MRGGTPDFRMTRDSDSSLIEATTSFSGIVDEDRQPSREAAVLAAVDQATRPNFTVRLEIEQVGPDQPKGARDNGAARTMAVSPGP